MNYMKQQRFIWEYCKDFNGNQAAIRAGYAESGARAIACKLLKRPEILEAIEDRKRQIAIAAEIDTAWVLSQWYDIATADNNELTQLRRVNCRHCHGYGNRYQWTEGEYLQACDDAIAAGKEPPDGMGGFGFEVNGEPAEGCPECGGDGVEVVHMADTRKVSRKGKTLYAGVQKTKEGVKIATRDKDAALLHIARYLGMLIDKKELSGPNGGPIGVANLTADDLTDDQLAAILAAEDDNA